MMKNRSMRGLALLTALGLVAVACGSDDEPAATDAPVVTDAPADEPAATDPPTDEPAATDAPADEPAATDPPTDEPAATDPPAEAAGALGDPNPASGEPVEFTYLWSGVAPAVDNSQDLFAAEAIVQWINEYGGGIGADGRPLQLNYCATNSDAALAAACGSEMIDSDTPGVLMNVSGEIEPWATPVQAAGIPIIAYSSADASLTDATLVSSFSNPVGGIAYAPAAVAQAIGAERTTIAVIDVPAASGPASALGPLVFDQTGAGAVNILPISPTAPDHNTDMQVEIQTNDPDLVWIIGNPAFCTLGISALRAAGFEGAIGGISNCIDDSAKEQLGADLEGVYLSYSAGEDPANADYQQFLAILDEFDDGSVTPNGTPVGTYVVLEGFHRMMADYSGDFDATSIAAHIETHGPVPVPTIDGAELVCDGTALAILATACTSGLTYTVLDAAGAPTTFTGVG